MAIDREKVISEFSKIEIAGNEEGMIPALGVYVQQLPTDFWNEFAMLMLTRVDEDLVESVEVMLERAAHECGYHTGRGIITSGEWDAIVKPMVEDAPEDVLHGAYAIFTAWGWADAEIVDEFLVALRTYFICVSKHHGLLSSVSDNSSRIIMKPTS